MVLAGVIGEARTVPAATDELGVDSNRGAGPPASRVVTVADVEGQVFETDVCLIDCSTRAVLGEAEPHTTLVLSFRLWRSER